MNLIQISPEKSKMVFDIIHENALWLNSKNIMQWPMDWLHSIENEINDSISLGQFYSTQIDDEFSAVVEIKTSPEEIWAYDASLSVYVHKLAILRKHTGKGLGLIVINLIKALAIKQGMHSIRLDCVAHNVKLRAYYESCGFTFIKEVKTTNIALALFECKVDS